MIGSAGGGVIHVHVEDGPDRSANLHRLTPSQLVILRLRATGMTNDAIATQLVVSPQTVRNHVQNAFKRLGVNDIVSALNALGWVKIR